MMLFVHKTIWIKVINNGHWYDNDYTYNILIQYDIFSNVDKKLSPDIIEDIEKKLSKNSSIEKDSYNFYNGNYLGNHPKLYYNISANKEFSYKREEIDTHLSKEICIMLNNHDIVANVFLNIPYELDMEYGHGIYPPKEFAIKYIPKKSDCPTLLYRKYYCYSDI